MGAGAVTTPYDGIGSEELARRLRAPRCLSLTRVGSTLDVVHAEAAAGAPAGTVVLADEQLAGRGRHGRRWHSAPGAGIWLGLLARPGPAAPGVLALRVGLAVAEGLRSAGVAAHVKWPNDVMLHDRKLAGVLCETRWHGARLAWVAVGIGMNVHGPLPEDLRARAIALDEVEPGITRVGVLERIVPRLLDLSSRPTLSAGERERFAAVDWLAGKRLAAPVAGVVIGLEDDGTLLVRTETEVSRIVGGSVVTA